MSKTIQVSGTVRIEFTVDLPGGFENRGIATDDPVLDAVIAAIPQNQHILLWGERGPTADVFLDLMETDIEIEEDERK